MSPREPLCIEWTESSWQDLDGIINYLLVEGVPFEAVEDYVKSIFKASAHLATLPGAGKPGRMPSTREWRVKHTPYALIYGVRDNKIQILRVMHHSRQFPEHYSNFKMKLLGGRVADAREACRSCLMNFKLYILQRAYSPLLSNV